jgi:hypothetical protein
MSILVLTSDTLIGTPATGNLEYNGQFYGTDSNASRAQMQRITQGTAVASTSGTSIDFTGLPAWVKRITVMINGLSTNGSSLPLVRIGTSSGFDTTGYTGSTWSSNAGSRQNTDGHALVQNLSATTGINSVVVITLQTGNSWMFSSNGGYTDSAIVSGGCSAKTTSAILDRVRITTVNGTDTFDAGSINILYEG